MESPSDASDYLEALAMLHEALKPRTYLEIGVAGGESLLLAHSHTTCIGVDPSPIGLEHRARRLSNAVIFEETSDTFFATRDLDALLQGQPLDLAFIDGMHLFEHALRDFMNAEANSHAGSVVAVHDCLPLDAIISSRQRTTEVWTGDVWKLVACLHKYRPDLDVTLADASPSGLAIITGLDRHSSVLPGLYEALLGEYVPLGWDSLESETAGWFSGLTVPVDEAIDRVSRMRSRGWSSTLIKLRRLEARLSESQVENDELRAKLAAHVAQLSEVYASTSWRLSAPVRLAGRRAGNLSRSARSGRVRRGACRLTRLLAPAPRPTGVRTAHHMDKPLAVRRISTYEQFTAYTERMREEHGLRHLVERELIASGHPSRVPGTCFVCGKQVPFSVDYSSSPAAALDLTPNWREQLICPCCHLNNRMRACIHILERECAPDQNSHIYATEQTTPLFTAMSARYRHLIGSEYLGDSIALGTTGVDAIRNESITRLTFPSDSFDYVLSFDVLEHVPDYVKGFSECFRCLKPGGSLCFTVPFTGGPATLVRACVNLEGAVRHILPPEYHGDPLRADGCLCLHHFGWDMLDCLRELGFRDVAAVLYWSRDYGYLGANDQVLFVARKPNVWD